MRVESTATNPAAYSSWGRSAPVSPGVVADAPTNTGAVAPISPVEAVADAVGERTVDPSDPILDELVEAINRNLSVVDKRLQFLVHEASGRVQLRVLERATNEVIREVPSEKLLDLVGRIHELIGLLIDETA